MSTKKSMAIACGNKILEAELHKEPFKYIVVDNFLPQNVAVEALTRFPSDNSSIWEHVSDDVEIKSRSTFDSEYDFPGGSSLIVKMLNSSPILKAVSKALDIPKLIPDPYFTGGGLNMQTRGGRLDVHVDGNYHDATGLHRRVNAIFFLNPSWQDDWGGEFGVYDTELNLVDKVMPIMNRLVVFDTHDKSFHGTPNPIKCPVGVTRKSIILYYYTKDPRPDSTVVFEKPHSALWKDRGIKDKNNSTEREYQ